MYRAVENVSYRLFDETASHPVPGNPLHELPSGLTATACRVWKRTKNNGGRIDKSETEIFTSQFWDALKHSPVIW